MIVQAIQTRYAGCHFRSRLEARWAVFFDTHHIPWEYEPQGFNTSAGPYLPDFLLTDCSTWVEVRGSNDRVNLDELATIAAELPLMPLSAGAERGPRLMLLGPIPTVPGVLDLALGDFGWLGTSGDDWGRYGFGTYHKNQRPWWLDGEPADLHRDPLTPITEQYEEGPHYAYRAARSARFEHGHCGAS